MNEFFEEKWERIKLLAARLQAIKNILEIFGRDIDNQPFAEEFKLVRRQLEADFDRTLNELLEIIDEDVNHNGNQ